MFLILALISICCISIVQSLIDPREEEFKRIQQYELIYFNLDSFESSQLIEFSAFGENYKVQLRANEHMIPAYIRHTNVNPAEHDDDWYGKLVADVSHP